MLNYPLTYNSIRLNGPTLFYIDEEGTPIQLQLEADQVQSIVTDWNATNHEDEDSDDAPVLLKPPLTLPCISNKYSPEGAGVTRDQHTYPETGLERSTCIHCGAFSLDVEQALVARGEK